MSTVTCRRIAIVAAALLSTLQPVSAQTGIQELPVGAGAVGKGPDAIVLPGYEDAPRPPAFDEQKRREVLEQSTFVDDYTPQPAFLGQTRAPKPAQASRYRLEIAAEGLERPWSLAFLPDGRMLVSETARGLRIVERDGTLGEPITAGLPIDFSNRGEQLLDAIPDRDFARTRTLYLLYRTPPPSAGDIGEDEEDFPIHYPQIEMAARAQLSANERRLTGLEVLLNVQGIEGRMMQGPDGKLYITSGPLAGRGILTRHWTQSQLPGSLMGKVVRIDTDGSVPADNPFVGRADTRPEIWAFGVRDAQSIAFDRAGRLWTAENGPMGGDEVNLIEKGKNYGFPIISYGREYSRELINGGLTAQDGLEQPVYFWTPSVAPSGLTFYTGELFPEWRDNLFIATMAPRIGRKVIRLVLAETPQGMRVVSEEWLLTELAGKRFREVKQGPEGALYAMTDDRSAEGDKIYRLLPR
jgi:glucose/arabinose dehydrogenase